MFSLSSVCHSMTFSVSVGSQKTKDSVHETQQLVQDSVGESAVRIYDVLK